MNNYSNLPKNYDYLANMLPINNSQQANYNYNQNKYYDPYDGLIRGNMFPSLCDSYKIDKPLQIQPLNEQAKMLTNIDALAFATTDLNIYLDVFPNDQRTIELFNQYRQQQNDLQKLYESKYGPLQLSSDALNTYPWAWENKPWPWQN
ncbi:MAG: spore coat protein CotJB [Bacilli bacterium]